jgi:hypothetical protein
MTAYGKKNLGSFEIHPTNGSNTILQLPERSVVNHAARSITWMV